MNRIIVSLFTIFLLNSSAFALDDDFSLAADQAPFDIPSQENIDQAKKRIQKSFGPLQNQPLIYSVNALSKYAHVDPRNEVPRKLLRNALLFFDKNKRAFKNKNYITVVDFSSLSNQPRFYLINMQTGLVNSFRTAHGAGGDRDDDGYVERLSNIPGSHMSSRGYYQVSEIYYGRYGRSIRLDGLSTSNSKARSRAIVLHGSDGMSESFAKQRLSWGCFMLAWSVKDEIVDRIHGGSLLYAEKSENL